MRASRRSSKTVPQDDLGETPSYEANQTLPKVKGMERRTPPQSNEIQDATSSESAADETERKWIVRGFSILLVSTFVVLGIGFLVALAVALFHYDDPDSLDNFGLYLAVGVAAGIGIPVVALVVSASRNGRPAVIGALKGVGTVVGIAAMIAALVGFNWWRDTVRDERVEANRDETAVLVQAIEPEANSSRPSPGDMLAAPLSCESEDVARTALSFVPTDGVASARRLHDLLIDDGFNVELKRFEGPLDIYEVLIVAGSKEDGYVDA